MSFKGFLVCEATVAIFGLRMYMPSVDGAVGRPHGQWSKIQASGQISCYWREGRPVSHPSVVYVGGLTAQASLHMRSIYHVSP